MPDTPTPDEQQADPKAKAKAEAPRRDLGETKEQNPPGDKPTGTPVDGNTTEGRTDDTERTGPAVDDPVRTGVDETVNAQPSPDAGSDADRASASSRNEDPSRVRADLGRKVEGDLDTLPRDQQAAPAPGAGAGDIHDLEQRHAATLNRPTAEERRAAVDPTAGTILGRGAAEIAAADRANSLDDTPHAKFMRQMGWTGTEGAMPERHEIARQGIAAMWRDLNGFYYVSGPLVTGGDANPDRYEASEQVEAFEAYLSNARRVSHQTEQTRRTAG